MVKHICTEINFSPGLLGRLIRAYYPSLNLEEKLIKANWAFAIVTLTLEISLLDSLIHELSILKKQFKTHLFNLFKLFFLYHHSKSTMTSYALPFNTKKRVTILSFYSMYKIVIFHKCLLVTHCVSGVPWTQHQHRTDRGRVQWAGTLWLCPGNTRAAAASSKWSGTAPPRGLTEKR